MRGPVCVHGKGPETVSEIAILSPFKITLTYH